MFYKIVYLRGQLLGKTRQIFCGAIEGGVDIIACFM